MLFDKTATIYTMSRNASMVSSRSTGDTIVCNIQPMGNNMGIGGIPAYNQYKMYTEYMPIKEGDKVVDGTDVYIVKDVEDWKGSIRTFSKVTMEKSRGN